MVSTVAKSIEYDAGTETMTSTNLFLLVFFCMVYAKIVEYNIAVETSTALQLSRVQQRHEYLLVFCQVFCCML